MSGEGGTRDIKVGERRRHKGRREKRRKPPSNDGIWRKKDQILKGGKGFIQRNLKREVLVIRRRIEKPFLEEGEKR